LKTVLLMAFGFCLPVLLLYEIDDWQGLHIRTIMTISLQPILIQLAGAWEREHMDWGMLCFVRCDIIIDYIVLAMA